MDNCIQNLYILFKGFSKVQLGSMEVLSALQHAEFRLGREFTKEEFIAGTVGQHMLPEDFDQEQIVGPRTMSLYSPTSRELAGFDFLQVLQCNWQLITPFPFNCINTSNLDHELLIP